MQSKEANEQSNMKKSFANEFKNNYSSAISRDINSIKENKEFETKGEKFTFKTKNQMDNNDIFTNENLMSNNEVPFVYTFRSVNENDEEFFRSENIMQLEANTSNYYEVTHIHTNENVFYNMDKDRDKDKQLDKDKDKDKEIDKYGSNISDRNTNYQSNLEILEENINLKEINFFESKIFFSKKLCEKD